MIVTENARKLVDLKTLQSRIRVNGLVSVANMGWRTFLTSVTFLETTLLSRIPEQELRIQFREFINRLANQDKEDLMSNLELIYQFLNPKNDLYKDIESVLSIIAQACVVKGVEAVVEGWVSIMELHSSEIRGLTNQVLIAGQCILYIFDC